MFDVCMFCFFVFAVFFFLGSCLPRRTADSYPVLLNAEFDSQLLSFSLLNK